MKHALREPGRGWEAFGALLLALACARTFEPSAPLDASALDAWLRSAPAPSDTSGSGASHRELDALAELVARRRGLAFQQRPELEAVGRSELVRRGVRWIETQTPAAQRDAEAELLERLELVPADFSWKAALHAVLARRLEAFYDPDTRRIVIDRALPSRLRQRVLAHELVHALVDQHFALGARLRAAPSTDGRAALLTLAEGDAEALVSRLEAAEASDDHHAPERAAGAEVLEAEAALEAELSADEPALPAVLARSLSAPYVDGRAAVQRLLESADFAAVDALYRGTLAGTHQLLAPRFPLSIPDAVPVLSDQTPPEPGWVLRHADVLGAQSWRTVLEEWLPPAQAADLAGGWDGDRLGWFTRGSQRLVVWEVRSDAERAPVVAQAVARGLRLSPPARDARTARASGFSCRAQHDGGVMGRWIQGRSVLIAALVDAAQTVQCDALGAWTFPATRRQTRSSDLGAPCLIGPT